MVLSGLSQYRTNPVRNLAAMGDRGAVILAEVRSWMVRENTTIVAVLCVIFAAKLLGDAVFGLGI
jgi:hypothetical protein